MSGHRELDETAKPSVANDNSAFLNFVDSIRNAMTPKDYTANMQAHGKDSSVTLPALELKDSASDVPPPPEIKLPGTSDKDLAQDGIKRSHGVTDDGKETNKTEFPNGIKIYTEAGGQVMTGESGSKITMGPVTEVTGLPAGTHEKHKGSGVYVDAQNRPVMTTNEDGSHTVYTDKGVYTAREDGTVTKETAIKHKNGTWTVVDTSTPLGGLRPSDLGH